MHKHINWLLIVIAIPLIVSFVVVLKDQNKTSSLYPDGRFYYNPYEASTNDELLNNPDYRQAYENKEANWQGSYPAPRKKHPIRSSLSMTLLVVFGVLGFGMSLLFRAVYIYCEWRDGNAIDWKWQTFLTLAVPSAYVFAMIEIMLIMNLKD